MGARWEPAAVVNCTSSFPAFGMSLKPGDILGITELRVQKTWAGLLPGLGLLTSAFPVLFGNLNGIIWTRGPATAQNLIRHRSLARTVRVDTAPRRSFG
ncbi:unnamed protein product [Tuwongella immobilis]|uniref:Uncharacterized protein n=1 Tax=Tuwongella immobilis TaxID=692036 RepID=A0A6C2YI22_9BACT|nr:unnamed protein product [Tuwongella immobilis]VTR97557.1 unnamed protein product [Tuwongella immobilis]